MRYRLHALAVASCLLSSVACTAGSSSPSPPPAPPSSPAPPATSAPPPTAAAVAPAPTAAAPTVIRTARAQGLGNVMQLALARGYFAEQGLDLQQVEVGTGADALPALSTGQLDAGSAAPLPAFFNALARGVRLALALDANHADPGTDGLPMVARLADGVPVVQELTDLRGKRIAQPAPGTIGEQVFERMLAEIGLHLSDLPEMQYLTYPNVLLAFGGGNIDLTIAPEPWGTIAHERGLGARVRDVSAFVPGAEISLIVFSEQLTQTNPEAAQRFAVAYLHAARDYMDAMELGRDRDAVIAQLATSTGQEPRILEQAGYLPINRNGRINVDALMRYMDWLNERNYVPQKPDIASMIDNRFADHAASLLDAGR